MSLCSSWFFCRKLCAVPSIVPSASKQQQATAFSALLPPASRDASRPLHSPAPAFRTTRRGKWSHSLVASSNLRGSHVRTSVPERCHVAHWLSCHPLSPLTSLLRVRSTWAPRATGNGSVLLTPRVVRIGAGCFTPSDLGFLVV